MRRLIAVATLLVPLAAAIDPRWGHAATYIKSTQSIVVHGGKTDPQGDYSYASAPNAGETLVLDLTRDFSTGQEAWNVIEGGPTVAWHTLDALSSEVVLFGGDGGSALPVQTRNDSTYLFTTSQNAAWHPETTDQPIRKVFSASSASQDAVYITGGEKNDGSGFGYAEAWKVTMDSATARYDALPDLPTDLVGHQSVLLLNGTIMLIGGLVPSASKFLSMTTLYTLDTTSPSAKWQTISLPSSNTPSSRRAHTATLVTSNGKERIYLLGGISGSLQGGQVMDDLWVLDLATGEWEEVSSASGTRKRAEGPEGRYDHVAVAVGDQVLVLGGYGSSGPVDAGLFIFDTTTDEWTTSYRAPTGVETSSASSSSSGASATAISTAASGKSSSTLASGTAKSAIKTVSATASITPSATSTPNAAHHSVNRTAIAVGTSLGVLAMLALSLALWFLRRRRQRTSVGNTLTPFGGRPARKRRFGKTKRGGEGLVGDKSEAWDVEEKDDLVSDDDEDRGMPQRGFVMDEGFTTSQPTYRSRKPSATGLGKASPFASNIASKIRQVSGRIASGPRQARFSMLEDEDREDLLWKGEEGSEDEGYEVHHVRERKEAMPDNEGDIVEGSTSGLSGQSSAPARKVQKELPIPPSNRRTGSSPMSPSYDNPFNEPLEAYYDTDIMSYVNGSVGSRPGPPKSSMNSRDSMTESMMADAVQVARRVSVTTAEASYVPLEREESWLKRVAGNGMTSFFRGNRQSVHQTEEGFLDPTTPPCLDSIREDESRVSSGMPSAFSNFGRSMTSIVSVATANSAFLDRYGQMNIVQREQTPTSQRSRIGDAKNAELPPVPKREILRPATPPRGPRPAPLRMPTHIDVGTGASRRPVKDIAASINRRGSVVQADDLPGSPLAQGEPVASIESPARARSSLAGPRPATTYQAVPKAPYIIANDS